MTEQLSVKFLPFHLRAELFSASHWRIDSATLSFAWQNQLNSKPAIGGVDSCSLASYWRIELTVALFIFNADFPRKTVYDKKV